MISASTVLHRLRFAGLTGRSGAGLAEVAIPSLETLHSLLPTSVGSQ